MDSVWDWGFTLLFSVAWPEFYLDSVRGVKTDNNEDQTQQIWMSNPREYVAQQAQRENIESIYRCTTAASPTGSLYFIPSIESEREKQKKAKLAPRGWVLVLDLVV